MRLPKIQEDEYPIKNDYSAAILAKPLPKHKLTKIDFDWQAAEIDLISRIPDQQNLITSLIDLQKLCKDYEVPHFYSFYFVRKILDDCRPPSPEQQPETTLTSSQKNSAMIGQIQKLGQQLKELKSSWNRVSAVIRLRQNSMGKLQKMVSEKSSENIYEVVDDLRFLNFDIVTKIKEWKQQVRVPGSVEEPMFFLDGKNYLIKMINDNTDLINALNSKTFKFLTPPNPFFISRDGNRGSMSQTEQDNISECMELMASEKAYELRLLIDPPKFVVKAKGVEKQELEGLKSQLQSDRVKKIKAVYQTNSSFYRSKSNIVRKSQYAPSSDKKEPLRLNPSLNKLSRPAETENEQLEKRRLEKLIKQKQVEVLKGMRSSSVRITAKKEPSRSKNQYIQKIENLRKQVAENKRSQQPNKFASISQQPTKNNIDFDSQKASQFKQTDKRAENIMRLSTLSHKSSLPQTVSQIKAPKPKIRLIMQKDTFVQDTVKALLPSKNLEMYKSFAVQKTEANFFKPAGKPEHKMEQKQKKEADDLDLKPITHSSGTVQASHFLKSQFSKRPSGQDKMNSSKSRSKSKLNASAFSERSMRSERKNSKSPKNKRESPVKKVDSNEENLRMVNTEIKNMTILEIYGAKSKAAYKSPNKVTKQKKLETKEPEGANLKESQHDVVDKQLRLVKNRLKQLSIREAYSSHKSPVESRYTAFAEEREKQKARAKQDRQQKRVELQKKIRAKQQNLVKIRNSMSGVNKDLLKKKQVVQSHQKQQQKDLAMTQKQKQELLGNLSNKDKRIEELLEMLKKQEEANRLAKVSQEQESQEQRALKKHKEEKMKELEQVRKKMSMENKMIQEKMSEEENKFIRLKEEQFKIREEEMLKKYNADMKLMKEQISKKNKEIEQKIIEEEKAKRDHELKIMQQQRQLEELKMQMEEKALKEQLLEEILTEQRRKRQAEQAEERSQQESKKDKLKREIAQTQELERKALDVIEQDNKKLLDIFESMRKRNLEIDSENQKKIEQLKKLEEEARAQEEHLRQLEQELRSIKASENRQQQMSVSEENNQEEAPHGEDIESLKVRVKQQILREMMIKKAQEEEENRKDEEDRKKKIQEMEDEIRKQLRRQQEEMEKIEKEERERYDRIRSQMEEQHRKKMLELDSQFETPKQEQERSDTQQNAEKQPTQPEQLQEPKSPKGTELIEQVMNVQQEPAQLVEDKTKRDSKGHILENGENKLNDIEVEEQKKPEQQQQQIQLSQKQIDHKKQQIGQIQVNQHKLEQKAGNISQPEVIKQKQQTQKQQPQELNQLVKNRQAKKDHQQQPSQTLPEPTKQDIKQAKEDVPEKPKPEEQQKPKIPVKQDSDELLNKYQELKPYLSKCKQLYIQDKEVASFLAGFYGSLSPEVKEMIPYSKEQVEKYMLGMQKKVDIFESAEGQSIGWLQLERYVLIGSIGCVESIVRKYGQVQIQMVYIFTKSNPYQKQFLTKQIKIFDKVGFIYQRKLAQDNQFSIKLIIKVPSEVLPKNTKTPDNVLTIHNQLIVEENSSEDGSPQHSVLYALSQTLKNCLGAQEELVLSQMKDQDSILLRGKMSLRAYNDGIIKSEQIDDSKFSVTAKIPLKFLQLAEYPYYVMKGSEWSVGETDVCVQTYPLSPSLTILILPYENVANFSLDMILDIKTKKMRKQRDLIICAPIWKKKQNCKHCKPGPRRYTFAAQTLANFSFGSITNTTIHKEEVKFIQTPFIFSLFETGTEGHHLIRPLVGEVVEKKDLVASKH